MPIGPIIGAGLNLFGGIYNTMQQREMNDQNWIRQAQMYHQQREDALADWNMQNAYNSPAAQMGRLRAAGLNPNLVYGSGSVVANSQSQPRGASPGGPTGIAPRLDLSGIGEAFMQAYQMGIMEAQKRALDQRAILDAAKTDTEKYKADLTSAAAMLNQAKVPFAGQLAQSAADFAKYSASEKFQQSNMVWKQLQLLNDTYDNKVLNSLNDVLIQQNILKKTDAEVELMKQKLKSEAFRTDVMEFQSRMAKANINPNQPAWMQGLMLILKKFGIDIFNL